MASWLVWPAASNLPPEISPSRYLSPSPLLQWK